MGAVMSGPLSGKNLLLAFRASLLLKGSFAVAEAAAGFMAYLVPPGLLLRMAQIVTRTELMEDPGDFLAVHLLGAAQGTTPAASVSLFSTSWATACSSSAWS